MLKLSGSIDPITKQAGAFDALFTITTDQSLPASVRNRFALLSQEPVDVAGYGVQLVTGGDVEDGTSFPAESTVYHLSSHFDYLKSGDIVFINSNKDFLHTLFRKESRHNSILLRLSQNFHEKGHDLYA